MSSLAEMMEWGLRGVALSRRRALGLRVGAVVVFLALWTLASGAVAKMHSLNRIPQKIAPESVFYTRLLEELDPKLVKWKSKTEVK